MATHTEKNLFDEKHRDWDSEEHVEVAGSSNSTAAEVTELSGIEATAASTAAWLISVTVSLGGFLFGYDTGCKS